MDGPRQDSEWPNLSALFKNKDKTGKLARLALYVTLAVLVLIIAFSGFYFLGSNEEAVITMFGKHVRTEKEAGLKFKIPLLEKSSKVDIELIRRMEFGYRSDGSAGEQTALLEARMLTSDENLVIADWAIMYKVVDSYKYLFSVDDQTGTLRTITEAAYRRVVAAHPLDDILTDQKESIQFEIKDSLQSICNKYDFGIMITAVQLQDAMPPDEVKSAFLEVASAKEDKTAKINEAIKYLNEKLPFARGEAQQILNQAEGYKQERINDATGAVARFIAIQKEFANNPDVTGTRLYLEAIRSILPGLQEIYIMDNSGDVLKFLPLNGTGTTVAPTPTVTPAASVADGQ
jgi:modulator of FtsH protease HflK